MEYHVYWSLKIFVLNFLEIKNMVFFEPKSWWKYDIYWLLKSSCFGFFGDEKYGLSCVKKLMERWNLLVTQKFLFWTFQSWEIRSFFSQKVDGKMIFTWSFLFFHDIPGPEGYGFSCGVLRNGLILIIEK